jgi:xylose isomerase
MTDLGKKIEQGVATLADCEMFILENGEPKITSAKQEKFERVFNNYFV